MSSNELPKKSIAVPIMKKFNIIVKITFYILNIFSMVMCIWMVESGGKMVWSLWAPNLPPLEYTIMLLEAVLFFMGAFFTLAFCVFAFVAEQSRARRLLVSYAIIVFIVAVIELIIGVYFFIHLKAIDAKVKVELNETLHVYGTEKHEKATEFLDLIQGDYGCCGVDSASDWKDTPYYKENHALPYSCCTPPRPMPTATCQIGGSSVHKMSCYQFTHWFIEFHYKMLSSLFFVAGTVQVLCVGMVLWMLFYTTKQVSKPEDSELKAEKPLKALGIELDIPSYSCNDEPKELKVV